MNSPRRILSFSKRTTTASVSFVDPDEKTNSGFGVSGEHGTKPSEVYGFVGSITTVVATGPNLILFPFSIISLFSCCFIVPGFGYRFRELVLFLAT